MSRLLIGRFDHLESVERAMNELRASGGSGADIEQFVLNAPRQHDQFPIGGDEEADRGARGGEDGAVASAAMGGAVGLAAAAAAMPVIGPLAAAAGVAVGAYAGSLAGAVHSMGQDKTPHGQPVLPRPAGVRVVVNLGPTLDRQRVIEIFASHHTQSVEEAEGTWRDGSWVDFDPVSVPQWI
ncbi:MAG: hypothetical protein ACXWBL_09145, partial [Usitatibacter sp.]